MTEPMYALEIDDLDGLLTVLIPKDIYSQNRRIYRSHDPLLIDGIIEYAAKLGGPVLIANRLQVIRLEYEKNGHRHLFFVSDDGVGLGEGDNRNLFKLFHRNETSRGIAGSGLGLAIIKEVTKRHHGDIWMEPAPEKGARFCISISSDLKAGP